FERRAFKASRSLKNAVVFRKVSDPWRTISNHVVVLNINSQYFGTIRHRRKSRVVLHSPCDVHECYHPLLSRYGYYKAHVRPFKYHVNAIARFFQCNGKHLNRCRWLLHGYPGTQNVSGVIRWLRTGDASLRIENDLK